MHVTPVGVDLAKSVFQVHGVAADRRVVIRKKLRRAEVLRFFEMLPPCLIGMEACAVAMANKTARIGWAVLARGGTYRPA